MKGWFRDLGFRLVTGTSGGVVRLRGGTTPSNAHASLSRASDAATIPSVCLKVTLAA